jgi:hypothetical protein
MFLNVYKLPNQSMYFRSLKTMFADGSILDINNILFLIEDMKLNTNYLGVSCIQAIELLNLAYNSFFGYWNKENSFRIQHIVCGLIIDYWNIKKYSENLGSISCYYDKSNDIRLINKQYPLYLPNAVTKFDKNNNYAYNFWFNNSTFKL